MKKKKLPIEGMGQKRVDKFVTVTDDWYPCYPNNTVKFSIFLSYDIQLNYHFVRMCVWGADDFGLELDYENSNYEELLCMYNTWRNNVFDKVPDVVDKQWFYEHGFYTA